MSRLPDRLAAPGMKGMAAQYMSQLPNCSCTFHVSTIKRVVIRVLIGIASGPVPEILICDKKPQETFSMANRRQTPLVGTFQGSVKNLWEH